MDEVRDRIVKRMGELKLRQVDLINLTGLSKGTISKWISGVNVPSSTALQLLANALQTTSDWIMSGDAAKSSMFDDFHRIEAWDDGTPLDDDEVEIKYYKDFSFACGSGRIGELLESETRKLRMSKSTLRRLCISSDNAIATTAEGDSMAPSIKDGDTIHVDLGRKTIKDGKIFAICHGGLFKAKRLYNLPFGGVRIVSDNSAEYPEEQLTADQIKDQDFQVLGWIWQISSLERW